ncbi:hypothetical protein J7H88_004436 [Vibrio parahaemolyticus]|nr:hypothetical protein [Vibrio parahaemolyticus]EJA3434510.1 hypothetical protein [Vibrio parahaemolyticus]
MKKFFKILAMLVALFAVLIGGLLFWAASQTSEVTAEATPFIEESVPLISTWEISEFEHLFSIEGRSALNSEEGQKVIVYLSKMGGLRSFESPVFIKSKSSVTTSGGSKEIAIFTVKAKFENGVGLFTFVLSKADSKYKIDRMNLNSNAFLDM